MDHGNRTVLAVHGAQQRKCDCVVASQRDHARQCFPLLRGPGLVRVGKGCAAQQQVVALLDLLQRIRIVVSVFRSTVSYIHRYIAT